MKHAHKDAADLLSFIEAHCLPRSAGNNIMSYPRCEHEKIITNGVAELRAYLERVKSRAQGGGAAASTPPPVQRNHGEADRAFKGRQKVAEREAAKHAKESAKKRKEEQAESDAVADLDPDTDWEKAGEAVLKFSTTYDVDHHGLECQETAIIMASATCACVRLCVHACVCVCVSVCLCVSACACGTCVYMCMRVCV